MFEFFCLKIRDKNIIQKNEIGNCFWSSRVTNSANLSKLIIKKDNVNCDKVFHIAAVILMLTLNVLFQFVYR